MKGSRQGFYLLCYLLQMAAFATAQTSLPGVLKDSSAGNTLLEDLVITGQFSAQSVRNSVYRVRVINQERIRMRGATDVSGVLNNELGVRFSTDYTLGETDIAIMGV